MGAERLGGGRRAGHVWRILLLIEDFVQTQGKQVVDGSLREYPLFTPKHEEKIMAIVTWDLEVLGFCEASNPDPRLEDRAAIARLLSSIAI